MKPRTIISAIVAALALTFGSTSVQAQFNLERLFKGVVKGVQAVTLSDEQVVGYVQEYVHYSDSVNKVLPPDNPYSVRLAKIVNGISSVDGIPLNFKVYQNDEVNAFACADGSVRVYTGLLDIMNDSEVLGVIGHEIGHVAHHDSRNAFKRALRDEAIGDAIASTCNVAAALTDSQLASIGETLVTSKFSRKQEQNADDYGYMFLKQTGHDPTAMVYAFRKLQSMEQANGAQSSAISQLFASHPDVGSRISRMAKKAAKDGYKVKP